jgi:hypothetical protein
MAEDKKTIQLKVVNTSVCAAFIFESFHTQTTDSRVSSCLQKEAVTFRVKATTKFSKILAAYCQKNTLDASECQLAHCLLQLVLQQIPTPKLSRSFGSLDV